MAPERFRAIMTLAGGAYDFKQCLLQACLPPPYSGPDDYQNIDGWHVGGTLDFGLGGVYASGEACMWSAIYRPGSDTRCGFQTPEGDYGEQLLLNIMHLLEDYPDYRNQSLAPDELVSSSNYWSIALADINEHTEQSDGVFGIYDGSANTVVTVGFPTPPNPPTPGADLQEFRVILRKSASAGNDPTWKLKLLDGFIGRGTVASGTLSDGPGVIVSGTWDASALFDTSGANVRLQVVQTSGGTGSDARGVEVGAAQWISDVH
jgi:hypothetical protein